MRLQRSAHRARSRRLHSAAASPRRDTVLAPTETQAQTGIPNQPRRVGSWISICTVSGATIGWALSALVVREKKASGLLASSSMPLSALSSWTFTLAVMSSLLSSCRLTSAASVAVTLAVSSRRREAAPLLSLPASASQATTSAGSSGRPADAARASPAAASFWSGPLPEADAVWLALNRVVPFETDQPAGGDEGSAGRPVNESDDADEAREELLVPAEVSFWLPAASWAIGAPRAAGAMKPMRWPLALAGCSTCRPTATSASGTRKTLAVSRRSRCATTASMEPTRLVRSVTSSRSAVSTKNATRSCTMTA
mmetsp:Transcript_38707/g.97262  ORF Transcript_38707/g.97262 Transcript_38707/m.97262 type:complete len:312 (+) Transcript_38707:496-1431(+)